MASITKIAYSKTYPVHLCWEKVFVEMQLEPGDDPRKALYEAKKQVENFHFESNKAEEKKAEIKVEHISGNEAIIKAINSFKEISGPNGLESFKLIVKGKPELETAYSKRLKELT